MSTIWTANDYSNILTVGAAAIGSILLIIFKSKCRNISICFGLLACNRAVELEKDNENPDPIPNADEEEVVVLPVAP
tara:strand:- start:4697 stop:4927 length:231 start_codon:yes stop_codon:yes gene_type:complete